jgi:MYXO-CTERM domain-containing protein
MMPGMRRPSLSKRWFALAPAAAYYAGIFLLSAQSRLPSVVSFRFSDKIIHALTFAGLGALLLWGFGRLLIGRPRAATRAAILAGAVGAGLDEIHQIFVPLRSADIADAAADVIGVLAAVGLAALLRRRRRGGSARSV